MSTRRFTLPVLALLACACSSSSDGSSRPGSVVAAPEACSTSTLPLPCDRTSCAVVHAVEVSCLSGAPSLSVAAGPPGVAYLAEIGRSLEPGATMARTVTLDADKGASLDRLFRENDLVVANAAGAPLLFGRAQGNSGFAPLGPPQLAMPSNDTAWTLVPVFERGTVTAAAVATDGTLLVGLDAQGPVLARRTPSGAWSTKPLVSQDAPLLIAPDASGGPRIVSARPCEGGGPLHCFLPTQFTEERTDGHTHVIANVPNVDDIAYLPEGDRYVFSATGGLGQEHLVDLIIASVDTTTLGEGPAPMVAEPCAPRQRCTAKGSQVASTALISTSNDTVVLAYVRADIDRDYEMVYQASTGGHDPGGYVEHVLEDRSTAELVVVGLSGSPLAASGRWSGKIDTGWRVLPRMAARGNDLLVVLEHQTEPGVVGGGSPRVYFIDVSKLNAP